MEIIANFLENSKFQIFDQQALKEKILVVGQVQSGKTRFMIEQSFEALRNNYDVAIILGGTNNNLLKQTQNRFNSEIIDREYVFFDSSDRRYKSIPKAKSLVVCLKGKTSLEKLINLIKNTVDDKRIIIFDDESDFGGINISTKESPSTINRLLMEIYELICNVSFISVTATPFADILSKSGNSFNRAHSLIPNEEYTGSKFFLENKNIYSETDESLTNLNKILIDHIKRIKDFGKPETQFLINNSLDTIDHLRISKNIYSLLKYISENLKLNGLSKEHLKIINELKENIFILNKDSNSINFLNKHSIIVGGALVSRGYTFERLLTTLMLNSPKEKDSADTLLQRARWFGYRRKDDIYKYMKVYLPQKTFNALIECDKLIEKVFSKIEDKNTISSLREYISKQKFEFIKPTGKNIK